MNLRPADAAELIEQTHSPATVLIGGQAVFFWARYFGISPRVDALTKDIDYLGTRAEALRASRRLKFKNEITTATLDDATPSAAVLAVEMEGYPDPILIDYLAAIIGVDSKAITRSAVTVQIENEPIRVLHPIQLLQSKIWNLYRLESKRTEEGIEQARLAIVIVAAYVDSANMAQKDLLKAIEAIGRFAATAPALFARDRFGLNCLDAIPTSAFEPGKLPLPFHEKRWPRLVAATGRHLKKT